MYGHALKCDICERIDFSHSSDFEITSNGWVRISVNNPRDYGWTFTQPKYSPTTQSVDCCSIHCAREFLSNCSNLIASE